jgi:hypothetical protein
MDYLQTPTIPRLEDAEIRRFVLGVADCQVFTTAHMRNNDFEQVGIVVFMALMGGLAPTPGQQVPEAPPEVSEPAPAILQPHPPKPTPPSKDRIPEPKIKEVSAKRIEELEFHIRWGRKPETAVEDYKDQIAAENASSILEYEEAMSAHETDDAAFFDEWRVACAKIDADNDELVRLRDVAVEEWQVQNAEQIKAFADWEAMCERWRQEFISNIGVIYEWMEKAGPRSVNGYPTFFSCRLLHKEDWERAKVAIVREQERRETIEV